MKNKSNLILQKLVELQLQCSRRLIAEKWLF